MPTRTPFARARCSPQRRRRLLCHAPCPTVVAALLVVLLSLLALPAAATLVGTIFSGPTTADPLAIYWNPAAMTRLQGTQGLIFGALSSVRAQYWRDTPSPLDGAAFPRADLDVPKPDMALGVVTNATLERFRFGLGFGIPIIEGATWEDRYDGKPSSTRYYVLAGRLAEFVIEPAAAFRINRYLSVGAGLDIIGLWISQTSKVDFGARLNQAVCALQSSPCQLNLPLSREDPTYDGELRVDGVGWGVGGYAGVLVSPLPWLDLGLTVHSGGGTIGIPVETEVEVPPAARAFVQSSLPSLKLPELRASGNVDVVSPTMIAAGVRVAPTQRLEIVGDLHWINKSEMSVVLGNIHRTTSRLITDQVLVKAARDDFVAGLRGSYRVLESLGVALRLEYGGSTRSERFTTPVSLDPHKISLHAGAVWQPWPWLALYLEYGHYFVFDAEVRESTFAPNASPTTPEEEGVDKPSPTGRYSAASDRVGLGVGLAF